MASPALREAAAQLFPIFYADLRRLARGERRRVGAEDTLQTTALIHEAYLRMRRSPAFNDHSHFLRAAALAMRQALINHARDRVAAKRGGTAEHLPLEYAESFAQGTEGVGEETLLAVQDAQTGLSALNARLAQVVECRFFAGYNEQETAAALGLNERTVRRDWGKARAWLRQTLKPADD